jgi:hypothetical protein
MKINRAKILAYYDKRCNWPVETASTVSAVTGMIGEDLVLGLLCHYLNGKIFSHTCKGSGKSGQWLDAWVYTKRALYQVEVKNWSAHSVGGLAVPDTQEGLQEVAERNLNSFLKYPKAAHRVWKVLTKLEVPDRFQGQKPLPLLAFWAPVTLQNAKSTSFWFDCKPSEYRRFIPQEIATPPQDCLKIFSASLYLRSLKAKFIELPMPRAEARIKTLSDLVGI